MTRVNELLRREIGEALYRLVNDQGFDLSSITVTQVEVTRDLREARVLVSIRDHEGERDRMMGQLRRHRAEFQELIAKHLTLKYTPRLMFQLDPSIEKGDRLLSLLSEMDAAAPAPGPEKDAVGNAGEPEDE